MVRRSLSEALGPVPDPSPAPTLEPTPTPPPAPPFAPGLVSTTPPHELPVTGPTDRYKLTVVLEEVEHLQLEALTAAVLAEVRPRRVGKGWRTKVVRALLAEAMSTHGEPDPKAVKRIARRLRET